MSPIQPLRCSKEAEILTLGRINLKKKTIEGEWKQFIADKLVFSETWKIPFNYQTIAHEVVCFSSRCIRSRIAGFTTLIYSINILSSLHSFSSITENSNSTKTERSGNRANIQLIEELPIGTTVNTCNGFDADLMNDLTFYLDPGNPYFTIHKGTGIQISVCFLIL